MEKESLEKKMREWAISLGYRMPDGSASPNDFFAALTATPSRCELAEKLVKSVQPRQNIEFMRKQLMVARMKNKAKTIGVSELKETTNKEELLKKQKLLEKQLKEKKDEVAKIEQNLFAQASDLLFEVCELSELEKEVEEYKERSLALQLNMMKRRKTTEEFEKMLLKTVKSSNPETVINKDNWKDEINKLQENLPEEFKSSGDFDFVSDLKKLREAGVTDEVLLEKIFKIKESLLDKFSSFLEEYNTKHKEIMSKKAVEIENCLNCSIVQLKQKIMEKSLEVLIHQADEQKLEKKLDKLMKTFEEELLSQEVGEKSLTTDQIMSQLKSHLDSVGKTAYHEHLKEELAKVEMEIAKKQEEKEKQKNAEKEHQRSLDSLETLRNEIELLKLELENQNEEINSRHDEVVRLEEQIKGEIGDEEFRDEIERKVDFVKDGAEKQVDLYLETPLDAFKQVDSSSVGKSLESETLSYLLKNHRKEFKRFFTSMLLSPSLDWDDIKKEIENRKKVVDEMKKFISEKQVRSEISNNLSHQLSALKFDCQTCDKNFEDSDAALSTTLFKIQEIEKEQELLMKILENWEKQPYRTMVAELNSLEQLVEPKEEETN